jgi:CRISPR-associated protein Cmr2
MGRAIAAMGSADEHRELSRRLAGFAGEARRIVERQHRGSLVYAGGDDVLAFLPLPEALACADAIRRGFTTAVAKACARLPEAERPTLSVGVGVGHVMESMGDLLALGREAEMLAKHGRDGERDRNALAVVVDKRSGGTHCWRGRWDEGDGGPVARLKADAELLGSQLSSRKVHEISRTLARMPKLVAADEPGWARMLALEVRRSLSRVHAGEGGVAPDVVGLSLDESAGYTALHAQVWSWIERMLVARAFAAAVPRLRLGAEEAVA